MPGVPNETAETAITKDGDGDEEEEDGAEREQEKEMGRVWPPKSNLGSGI